MKVDQQLGFLLHERKLSDSKRLFELVTQNFGIVSMVGRVATKKQTPVMPFSPLLVSWVGKNQLKTLTAFEYVTSPNCSLTGQRLFCGFYLNEITHRIAPRDDFANLIFTNYESVLRQLVASDNAEPLLRNYEQVLLSCAGYEVSFRFDVQGQPLEPTAAYSLYQHEGFKYSGEYVNPSSENIYSGSVLLGIDHNEYHRPEVSSAAKIIMRMLLKPLLGQKPLKSRELFTASFS